MDPFKWLRDTLVMTAVAVLIYVFAFSLIGTFRLLVFGSGSSGPPQVGSTDTLSSLPKEQ